MMTMKDDRVPLMLQQLDAAMMEEMSYMSHIGGGIWKILGRIAGVPAQSLRGEAISAALVIIGYIKAQLREAREGAWALLQGDRRNNLMDLSNGPSRRRSQ